MIDERGYRLNVGIVLANQRGQLLWARRVGQNAWQFPQGGIQQDESPKHAMYRELREEVGLLAHQVEIVACTKGWLHYRLPDALVRRNRLPVCIGQKQKWFLLRLVASDSDVRVDHDEQPEFDCWRWVSYWYPLGQVVFFKREVYRRALLELAPQLQALAINGD
jgi:putative (di)nucleoside polyphosphate hydrolase